MNRFRSPLWIALIVFLVNLAVRLIHADAYFPHGDEPFTVYFAQWPAVDIYKIVSSGNNPPTFEILLHLWMKIFGVNAFGLRLLSTLLISLASLAVALISQKIGGIRLMISASVLFLLTNFQMDFAHTVRAYALLICSSCWSMYFFLSALENRSQSKRVGWVIASFFTIASHYFGWFIIVVQWLSLLTFKRYDRKTIKFFLINNGILLLLYAPLLIVMIKRYFATLDEGTFLAPVVNLQPFYQIGLYALNSNEWLLLTVGAILFTGLATGISKMSFSKWLKSILISLLILAVIPLVSYFSVFSKFMNWPFLQSQNWALFSMLFFTVLFVIILYKSRLSFELKTLLLWGVFPLFIAWFCSFKIPIFLDRYLAHILTAFCILIPLVILSWSKRIAFIILPVISFLFLFSFQIAPPRVLDSPRADIKLKQMKKVNTVVIVSPGYQDFMFSYFYQKELYTNTINHRVDTLGEKIINESNSTTYKEGLRRALRKENIYFINEIEMLPLELDSLNDVIHYEFNTAVCYPENAIKDSLEAEFGPAVELESFPEGIYLYHYKRQ